MTITYKQITLEEAKKIIEMCETKAKHLGIKISTAIVTNAGNVVLHSTQDGTMPAAIDIALQKARTSAGTLMATMDFYDFIQQHKHLADSIDNTGLTMIGGGLPIMDTEMIGAIGVSGGLYSQDIECAEAGLKALK